MAKKKKKEFKSNPPDPKETTVDLYLPPHLYAAAKNLHDTEPELYTDLVRAVFARDTLYGISGVNIKPGPAPPAKGSASAKAGKGEGHYKTCDPGP
jgi:hypothetical protein